MQIIKNRKTKVQCGPSKLDVIFETKQFEIVLVYLPQLALDALGHLLEVLCSELLNLTPAVHIRPLRLHCPQPKLGGDASVVLAERLHRGDHGVVDRAERAGHVHGPPVMVVHTGTTAVGARVVVLQDGVS